MGLPRESESLHRVFVVEPASDQLGMGEGRSVSPGIVCPTPQRGTGGPETNVKVLGDSYSIVPERRGLDGS
jgi:hypothetical protein